MDVRINPLHLKSDQHLTALYCITVKSLIKIMDMKGMIVSLKGFDC